MVICGKNILYEVISTEVFYCLFSLVGAQGSLLALCSGILPGGPRRPCGMTRIELAQPHARQVPTCFTIEPACLKVNNINSHLITTLPFWTLVCTAWHHHQSIKDPSALYFYHFSPLCSFLLSLYVVASVLFSEFVFLFLSLALYCFFIYPCW